MMSTILRTLQQSSWIQRLFVLVLACNMVLILWGIRVVPAAIATLDSIGSLATALGLQVVIAALALFGPLSFQRCAPASGPVSCSGCCSPSHTMASCL